MPRSTPLSLLCVTSSALFLLLTLTACGPEDDNGNPNGDTTPTPDQIETPSTYTFASKTDSATSSVSYSGQTARHALIEGLNDYMGSQLEQDALSNTAFGSKQDFLDAMLFYYTFDSDAYTDYPHSIDEAETPMGSLEVSPKTYAGISSGKDLQGKFAGNDASTDHMDWSTQLRGWSDTDFAAQNTSAEGLLLAMMDALASQAYDLSQGTYPKDPTNDADLPVYVTPEGRDLKQLIQKFLLMGITFSQAADDYLDDASEDKGLLASNATSEESAYTPLEHAWDEGFGYFGAARNYLDYTDAQIADGVLIDTDDDGTISLTSEYNFGASINAAKRDKGSKSSTDFTQDAFLGFVQGRTIITNAPETLDEETLGKLKTERDRAIGAWEEAIAATAVHYINDTLQEMHKHSEATNTYDFAQHAKVWSELKGFSLGFQFNPRSPMLEQDRFTTFHALIKDAPVLTTAPDADFEQYKKDLIAARDILQQAYGFDAANMGDDMGQGGW